MRRQSSHQIHFTVTCDDAMLLLLTLPSLQRHRTLKLRRALCSMTTIRFGVVMLNAHTASGIAYADAVILWITWNIDHVELTSLWCRTKQKFQWLKSIVNLNVDLRFHSWFSATPITAILWTVRHDGLTAACESKDGTSFHWPYTSVSASQTWLCCMTKMLGKLDLPLPNNSTLHVRLFSSYVVCPSVSLFSVCNTSALSQRQNVGR